MSAHRQAQQKQAKSRRTAKGGKSEKMRLKAAHEKGLIEARRGNPNYAAPDFTQAGDASFEDDDFDPMAIPPTGQKRKLVVGLFLVPVCIVAVVTLLELFFRATVDGKFW